MEDHHAYPDSFFLTNVTGKTRKCKKIVKKYCIPHDKYGIVKKYAKMKNR